MGAFRPRRWSLACVMVVVNMVVLFGIHQAVTGGPRSEASTALTSLHDWPLTSESDEAAGNAQHAESPPLVEPFCHDTKAEGAPTFPTHPGSARSAGDGKQRSVPSAQQRLRPPQRRTRPTRRNGSPVYPSSAAESSPFGIRPLISGRHIPTSKK